MIVRLWGTRGSLASSGPDTVRYGGNTSSVEVRGTDGSVFVTDNANYIYDCKFTTPIKDPQALQAKLLDRAGIVETGLFLGIAKLALIAEDDPAKPVRERAN